MKDHLIWTKWGEMTELQYEIELEAEKERLLEELERKRANGDSDEDLEEEEPDPDPWMGFNPDGDYLETMGYIDPLDDPNDFDDTAFEEFYDE
ncbi:hypothetical protein [Fibrobacter sp. UWH4]|uniref:hypothetical protein n=1 Tax=Fibrobacter sp. UWH4 TaxID=1896210 RepID=UPI00090EEB06|nr:hypothetical protein [Fibrobacter sp. UWH4]SHL32928.1 hypothetical protein SAMN05720762_105244 [Fibrobacter sp. UWH4]